MLSEEQVQVRDTVRRFADEAIRPLAGELDESERFPEEIYREMAALGLFGIGVPAELGGAGMDTQAYALVMEELSRGYASVADQCGLVELIGTLLVRYGTDAQRERYLGPTLRAERRCAYAITEAEAGSDVSGIRTTATKTPGGWRLDGGKLWIHNAPICDFAVVLARTDKDAGHRGMSIFIVDRDRPGFSVGKREHKMGQRASPVGALHFDGIELPEEALLGPLNRGFHIMMSVLDKGRVGIAALAVGIAQAGMEAALGQAAQRKQFGRAILDNQGLQWMLADMAQGIQAARLLTWDAARKLDAGDPATTMACSMAKCTAGDVAVRETANAVQVFGGTGYIKGFEVERLYRDAKICQIYEGTNQIQRTIIARELIKAAGVGV
ncbi:MAG: acyl-CoA dehydrogenase family protein [Geminicoccaceae bacterium]